MGYLHVLKWILQLAPCFWAVFSSISFFRRFFFLLYYRSIRRVHTEWQRPLSGVHSITMEKLAQAGEGGGRVHALPLSLYLLLFTKMCCTLQLRGQIDSPYFHSTLVCTLRFYSTFHHDGKISPGWWELRCAPTLFHFMYHHVQRCGVRSNWQGR